MPFNETEYYIVREGVGRPHCSEEQYTDFTLDVASAGKLCYVYVKNTGNITGDWTIKAKFIVTEAGGGPESTPLTKEISPNVKERFEYTYDGYDTPRSCTHVNVKIPTVEICKYTFHKNVTRTRVVTKMKEVTKTRTVPCD
ncbi:hypothetical protein ACFL96_18915 [Thermoproteota archaeon]